MTAPIVLSKGVSRYYKHDEAKLIKVEKDLVEFCTESERRQGAELLFVPYPPNDEDEATHKDKQIQIQFCGLDDKGGVANTINARTTLIMVMPLHIKKEGRNIWYAQLKDEFGKIELDYATYIAEGHQRVRGENND